MVSPVAKPLILVDGSSYLYRAFHALPALTNSAGFPTGAVYGISTMLQRLLNDYQPEYIAVVFDAPGKTFRNEIYAEYKANRQQMPAELIKQIKPIYEVIAAMGIPIISIPQVEADDVIGSLATQARAQGISTLISTGDKDLAQLVDDKISLVNTMTGVYLDEAGVMTKFGIPPGRIIDYLILVGDSSDNVPGVTKVGPKTAVKWLTQYGSLAQLLAHAAEIPGKIGENLRQAMPKFPLIQNLVTIKRDVEIKFDLTTLRRNAMQKNKLLDLFTTMEFKSLISSWLSEVEQTIKNVQLDQHYLSITTPDALTAWIARLAQTKLFACTLATSSPSAMQAELIGIAFALSPQHAAYIPFGHDYANVSAQLSRGTVLAALKTLLEDEAYAKIMHHAKYDMEVLARYGIKLRGVEFDPMLESYVLDSNNNHNLAPMAFKQLGLHMQNLADIAGKGIHQLPFNRIELDAAARYAAQNADVSLQLHHNFWPKLTADAKLKSVLTEIEMPLLSILAHIELHGVLIDANQLQQQETELKARLAELETQAYQLAEHEFNLNSPKQLQNILFEHLKLPIKTKTPKGQASTADSVLQELALSYELPRVIIEHRRLSKIMSTYTMRLIEQINPQSGRVHTSYNQAATATGRLSSSEPNLQNIPIRSPEGQKIRQAFIAPPGYKIISADYSQIELRLMAHISQDENLLHAFAQNIDIHAATAAELAGISLDCVTPELRRNAKAINFGLLYGMSAFGLSRQLDLNRYQAQEYIDLYFTRYPKVRQYMDNTRKSAKQRGFVETLWGRRLYLPDINSRQIARQKAAERTAINAPLQGSAADIIKLAMIQIDKWLNHTLLNANMIMQVHDELVFEVHEDAVEAVCHGIRKCMMEVATLQVPLLVAIGVGNNWGAASAH